MIYVPYVHTHKYTKDSKNMKSHTCKFPGLLYSQYIKVEKKTNCLTTSKKDIHTREFYLTIKK